MMDGQVIKTYSKKKPVALFKTESRLVPSIPERLSNIRESRLNDKTLEIGALDDTFDRLFAGTKTPLLKNSQKPVVETDVDEIVFKVPQQTQKCFGKNDRETIKVNDKQTLKYNEEKQKTDKNSVSGKSNNVKQKRPHSDCSNENDAETSSKSLSGDAEEKAPNFVERRANKKKKLSHVKENGSDIKLKECTVSLKRFNLSIITNDNELNINRDKLDKENVNQSNDSFLKIPESWKPTNPLTSTPVHKRKLSSCLENISPITSNKVSSNNYCQGSPLKNNTNVENRTVAENMSLSSISQSLFSNYSLEKSTHSRKDDYPGTPVDSNKSLNGNKISQKSFVESPLLFDDTITNEGNEGKNTTENSLTNMKNDFNTISIAFNSSMKNSKTLQNPDDSGKNISPKFYESSYIPDDWTNDYNSSYEYLADKNDENEAVESTTKNIVEDKDKNFDNLTNSISTINVTSFKDPSNHSIECSFTDDTNIEKDSQTSSKLFETSVVEDDTMKDNALENVSEKEVLKNCTLKKSYTDELFSDDRCIDTSGKMTSNEKEVSDVSKISSQRDSNKFVEKKECIEDLCPKQLCVLISKLNYTDIKNKLEVRCSMSSDKETPNRTIRKSRRLSSNSNKDSKLDDKENNSLSEASPDSLAKKIPSPVSEGILQKNNLDLDVSELELRTNLLKMKNSEKVTLKRIVKRRCEKSLEAIAENFLEPSFSDTNETELNKIKSSEAKISNENEPMEENALMNGEHENSIISYENQAVFLKPGKSWARSLSIINKFHNGYYLDEKAVSKGKIWNPSIQTVLNMQPGGTVQKDNDKEGDGKMYPPLSPTRFSRRFSIRIIPSGKRSTLTDDFFNSNRVSSRKGSVTRKTSLKSCQDTVIETEDDLIRCAKNIILKRCNQTSYLSFSECFPDSYTEHCRKIGEGVYGEVFLYAKDDVKSVIKIIPIEGDQLVNCEPQKKFHEILSEIIISEELHELRRGAVHNTNGFVGVNRIMCVIGKYPDKLVDLWNVYDKEKKSENDCPTMFGDEQLFIILELAHGGQDLEIYNFQNAAESYSIFLQISYSLAVAEQSLEFEHRDLHWGNVLISKTDEKNLSFKLNNNEITLPTKGVKVSVIDFTLSRMSYKGCKIFNDLALDPTLFAAQGEYQFDIYRMMRDSVNNDWQQFIPYTNVLWLDYTLDKMITAARYKKKTTRIHKNAISHMQKLRKSLLNYKSASDFVSNCKNLVL